MSSKEYMREYRVRNREKRNEYNRRWRAANPGKSSAATKRYIERYPDRHRVTVAKHAPKARENRLKRLYGLTQAQYDQMLAAQEGRCGICQRSGLQLHVDHDHVTGAVRALLCVTCNNHLGVIENSDFRGRAEAYLERFKGVSL